jgi:hypothetical protein
MINEIRPFMIQSDAGGAKQKAHTDLFPGEPFVARPFGWPKYESITPHLL